MGDKYRHEYKYLIDAMQMCVMQQRAAGLLALDENVGAKGSYSIRSLYFDDLNDTCFFENEAGVDPREKYRIRIYNADSSRIVLERKSKIRGMTHKSSALIDEQQCFQLMRGSYPDVAAGEMSAALHSMLVKMKIRNMKPKVIVEYERIPYVSPLGNVRVTFDKYIMSSNDIAGFLEKDISRRPVLDTGKHIMEVKWDEYLPSYIRQHLDIEKLRRTSFSKYCLCRKYNEYGGLRV